MAGSIGAAVFVGIMTLAQNNAAARMGENAPIHGMNIAFVWMAIFTVAMLLLAVFGVRKQKKTPVPATDPLPPQDDEATQ